VLEKSYFGQCGFGDPRMMFVPRPPLPATAYRPRQTHPENLPWQRRTTHLIKIKYCEDTRPEQQLQAAHAHHGHLRRSIAGNHVLHVILLGVGGVIYIPHTLVPQKSLGVFPIGPFSLINVRSFLLLV